MKSVVSTTVSVVERRVSLFLRKIFESTKGTPKFLWLISALGGKFQIFFCLILVSFLNYKHFAVIIIFTFRPHCCGIVANVALLQRLKILQMQMLKLQMLNIFLIAANAQNNPTLLPAFTIMSFNQDIKILKASNTSSVTKSNLAGTLLVENMLKYGLDLSRKRYLSKRSNYHLDVSILQIIYNCAHSWIDQ